MKIALSLTVATMMLVSSVGCSGRSARRTASNRMQRAGNTAVAQQRAAAEQQRQRARAQANRAVRRIGTDVAPRTGGASLI